MTVGIGNLIYVDGDGNVATKINNLVFNIIQFPGPAGRLTNVVFNFDQYNTTYDYLVLQI
jgi:hypothetical protein